MPPQVFAHRGHCAEAPENTLSSFRAAERLNADGIELDVHLTRDGHPVVLHDNKVDRTTNGTGPVAGLTLTELQVLDAGAGERVPTLGETFQNLGKTLRINIELKGADKATIVAAVVAEILEYNMLDRAYIATDEATWLQAHALEPRLTGCYLGPHPRNTKAFLEKTQALACRIVQLDWRIVDGHFVDMAHCLNIEVHAMDLKTNHEERIYDTIFATDIDAVLTDYPQSWLCGK